MTRGASPPPVENGGIDSTVAHSPRIWNYWLGGKDNFEVDRLVGEPVRRDLPADQAHRAVVPSLPQPGGHLHG